MVERIQRTLELAHPQRATSTLPPAPLDPAVAANNGATEIVRTPASSARVVPLDREMLRERRVILPDETGAAAHAYRMLRTQILRQARAHKLRMIGVVSAVDGEGKTLTAVNLAFSLAAEPNQTALLVDLDLRQPGVAPLLWLGAEQGLDDWFEGETGLADLFVSIEGIERLRVLPTLRPIAGSSELLAGARAHELLAELRGRYADRLVIVDLPPVLLADDFLTIAPQLDCVLLVVSEGYSRREDVSRMKELLGGVRVLGTVLNASAESEHRSY
ncbi:MAG TPA: CpsD/CapB family tyrosine-protein kinase [Chloroflexota bacterium]|nr:CpsD/CapB family tyrosine-protein kinase [Chloroflexota bacterium]